MVGNTLSRMPAALLVMALMVGSLFACAPAITIVAAKVVCASESALPNWGAGGPDITAATAADFVSARPGCHLQDGKFQWASLPAYHRLCPRLISADIYKSLSGASEKNKSLKSNRLTLLPPRAECLCPCRLHEDGAASHCVLLRQVSL